jgi:hypothetical protein
LEGTSNVGGGRGDCEGATFGVWRRQDGYGDGGRVLGEKDVVHDLEGSLDRIRVVESDAGLVGGVREDRLRSAFDGVRGDRVREAVGIRSRDYVFGDEGSGSTMARDTEVRADQTDHLRQLTSAM